MGLFARTWLSRQLRKGRSFDVPAGSTPTKIDLHLSSDYFNVLSFFLIGAGFAYLLTVDLGAQSSSLALLVESLMLMTSILGLGFTSYITRGTSGNKPYQERWTVWHGRNAVIPFTLIISILIPLPFLTTLLEGTDNWAPAIIQSIIGITTIAYIMRRANFESEQDKDTTPESQGKVPC